MTGPPLDGHEPPRTTYYRNRRPAARKDDGVPKCEHCGKPIVWAFPTLPIGAKKRPAYADKPRPFDAEPDTAGRFSLYDAPAPRLPGIAPGTTRKYYTELSRLQAKGFREAGRALYAPHFGNCPKKDEWGQRGQAYGSASVTR